MSTVEKVSLIKTASDYRSRLGDQPARATWKATRPEKINDAQKTFAEVWDCKSSDHIKGCDGNVSTLIDFLIEGQPVRTSPTSWPFPYYELDILQRDLAHILVAKAVDNI